MNTTIEEHPLPPDIVGEPPMVDFAVSAVTSGPTTQPPTKPPTTAP
jgi:hypothetical protein